MCVCVQYVCTQSFLRLNYKERKERHTKEESWQENDNKTIFYFCLPRWIRKQLYTEDIKSNKPNHIHITRLTTYLNIPRLSEDWRGKQCDIGNKNDKGEKHKSIQKQHFFPKVIKWLNHHYTSITTTITYHYVVLFGVSWNSWNFHVCVQKKYISLFLLRYLCMSARSHFHFYYFNTWLYTFKINHFISRKG